jgi:predicted nucleic acid-binding protein
MTSSVYNEVVTEGKAKGVSDALRVEKAIVEGRLSVVDLTAGEKKMAQGLGAKLSGLSRPDCETLACAKERDLTLLIEDRRGRNTARAYAIPYITIQVFPLYGLINGKLSAGQCDGLLADIGRTMQTDLAVLEALRAAAREIRQARGKE